MLTIKTKKDIKTMKESALILATVMEKLKEKVEPGISTKELDNFAESLIRQNNARPAFKGYQGFPNTLCVSVNEVIVHGIPSEYKLEEGDIVSLDLGVLYKEFFSDMAVTVPIGNINAKALQLIRVTEKSLELAIKKAKPGNSFGDIGNTVQKYVESQGFNVVRELCGHGIGRELHQGPEILNYGKAGSGIKIKEGMAFCIEPMVTVGDWRIKKSQNGFGLETKDGSLSAHFEHTLAIVEGKCQILTKLE